MDTRLCLLCPFGLFFKACTDPSRFHFAMSLSTLYDLLVSSYSATRRSAMDWMGSLGPNNLHVLYITMLARVATA
jgi:hypothetical protein